MTNDPEIPRYSCYSRTDKKSSCIFYIQSSTELLHRLHSMETCNTIRNERHTVYVRGLHFETKHVNTVIRTLFSEARVGNVRTDFLPVRVVLCWTNIKFIESSATQLLR